jgi:hypothetical protein
MTKFLTALQAQTNTTYTENMGVTNKSTLSPVVDYFSLAGAMRNNPDGSADLFEKAYRDDALTAVRTLFYLRDVRGGQGERDVFRAGLRRLYAIDRVVFDKVALHAPFYGRWDDLFFDSSLVTPRVIAMVRQQLQIDSDLCDAGKPVSLLAKWLYSENVSSLATKTKARFLMGELRRNPRQYRKTLSKIRAHIHLLEHDMSQNNWEGIDFSKLPSQAHRKHTKAFNRRVPALYAAYLESVQKGEAKINVSTVYPYEIYDMAHRGWGEFQDNQYANVAWENLPDYTGDSGDALVMADVSGSMTGRPMSVSVSLALYFAERNKGAYKNFYMSFSGEPALHKVHGANLAERLRNIEAEHVGYNTDLSKAFRAILAAAKTSGEVPEVLYIISDMEFDSATSNGGYYSRLAAPAQDTIFRTAKREFSEAGFELPHVVFWNVSARNMQAPATILDGAVSLVSGCSPTVFGMAVQHKSPLELVHDVVNAERYQRITL